MRGTKREIDRGREGEKEIEIFSRLFEREKDENDGRRGRGSHRGGEQRGGHGAESDWRERIRPEDAQVLEEGARQALEEASWQCLDHRVRPLLQGRLSWERSHWMGQR